MSDLQNSLEIIQFLSHHIVKRCSGSWNVEYHGVTLYTINGHHDCTFNIVDMIQLRTLRIKLHLVERLLSLILFPDAFKAQAPCSINPAVDYYVAWYNFRHRHKHSYIKLKHKRDSYYIHGNRFIL